MAGNWKKANGQLSLDLALPPPQVLFFAVLPPPALAAHISERMERWRRRHDVNARVRPSQVLHVSMNAVGICRGPSSAIVRAAMEAGRRVQMAPFEVTFDIVMGFKNTGLSPFVLCARNDPPGLSCLRRVIGSVMGDVGFRDNGRAGFKPHVTMMYTDHMLPIANVDEPIRWTVRDFVLVRSLWGLGRHEHCQRWSLRG